MLFSLRLTQLRIGMADVHQYPGVLAMVRTARFRIIHFGMQTLTLPLECYQISAAWHNERPVAALVAAPAGPGALWIRACGLDGVSVIDHPDLIGLLAATLVHHADCQSIWYSADSQDPWLTDILHDHGFTPHTMIIGMEQRKTPPVLPVNPFAALAELTPAQQPYIAAIDAEAFSAEWQKAPHDLDALHHADRYALLATVDDTPVGYALATWHEQRRFCHLVRIAVLPQYQGRGIAHQLLAAVLTHAHSNGAAHITLNTQHDNTAAIGLYTRMGFVRNGEAYRVSRATTTARDRAVPAAH